MAEFRVDGGQDATTAGIPDSAALPSDVVRGGSRRLAALATLTAVMASAASAIWLPSLGHTAYGGLRLTMLLVIAVVSILTAVAARRTSLDARQLYLAGIVYLCGIAFLVAVVRHLQPWGEEVRGISAIALVMVLFPVIVPCLPTQAWLATGLATLCSIAGYGVTLLAGLPGSEWYNVPHLFRGEILGTAAAGLVASVVFGLGRKLGKARRLGAYELQEQLAVGGMGEVWRASHALLARPAAVKLIRGETLEASQGGAREALVVRFQREAQATSTLRNPHTVEVYDFGVTDGGTFYYVMELLDGIDLTEFVKRFGAMDPARVVYVLRQICRSLGEAHDQGLVHRDVKPSNVLLCRYGGEYDFVKVLDFGLVSTRHPEVPDARLTVVGQLAGTPAFMSPEQAKGGADLDARADVYALGCVAYWLLAGEHVFAGTTPMETLARHITEAPQAVSGRAIRPVPPELEALVMACLQKDPNRRPPSAVAVAAALASIPLERPWTEERARQWWLQSMGATPGTPPGDANVPSTAP